MDQEAQLADSIRNNEQSVALSNGKNGCVNQPDDESAELATGISIRALRMDTFHHDEKVESPDAGSSASIVSTSKSDPLRNRKASPSTVMPMAFMKSLTMVGEEFPLVFEPEYFYRKYSKNDKKDVDQYVHYRNIIKSIVLSTSVFGFGGVLVALIAIDSAAEHFEKWYALSFLTLWIVYAVAILWTVRDSENRYIYRILTSSSIPPKYPRISMAAQQFIFMNQPVGSLSELCHIEGATTTQGLTYCTSMAWVSILFFLLIMRFRRPCEFQLQWTDISMYLGGCSLYGVQLFKLDLFHDWLAAMHLAMPASGAIFVTVPYGFQQLTLGAGWIRILYYWVLVIAALFCLWLSLYWFGTKRHAEMVEKYKDVLVNEMTNEIRQDISSLSRKIIWFEVTAIMLTAVVVFLWMWQYDSACDLGCVGPYKDECH